MGTAPDFNMFYIKDEGVPWRKSGTSVIAAPTPLDALKLAGLDYKVGWWPVQALSEGTGPDDTDEHFDIAGRMAIGRMMPDGSGRPDGELWAIFSDRYAIFQNEESADFLKALAGAGVRVHTAGYFGGGRLTWLLGRVDKAIEVVEGDWVDMNIMLANSFDGTQVFTAGLTSVRVVCRNTFGHALAEMKGSGKRIGIRHVGNLQAKVKAAQEALGIVLKSADKVADSLHEMAATPLTAGQFDDILVTVIPGESTRSSNQRETIKGIYDYSPTVQMPGVANTAWGALNAFTYYVDQVKGNATKDAETRLESGWFGSGATMKEDAMNAIHLVIGKGRAPQGPVTIAV